MGGKILEKIIHDGYDEFETQHRTKSGDVRDVQVVAQGVNLSGRRVFQTVFREALQKNEAHLRLQMERMPIACIVWNRDFCVESWNPAAQKIFGFTATEVLGKHAFNLIVPRKVQPLVDDIWERLLAADDTAHSINENLTKDGRTILCDWLNTPLKGADGSVIRVLSMVQDITEKRSLEEQLRQAQKMEAIGQLAGGIAHDFNNVLTGILGYSQMIVDQVGRDSEVGRDLIQIHELGKRAAGLTQQLLTFSRKQPLQTAVLNLNTLIDDALKILARLVGAQIEFKFIPGHRLSRVEVDPRQIEQVLMNLAINARDAMPDGGRLTIETANVIFKKEHPAISGQIKAGRWVMLAVRDTGHGMDEATQARIFEPFFTSKKEEKGTGLGLSMVYGIVKKHGGYIRVDSKVNQGTTFTIYLSAVEEQDA
ncbi:MAG: PAS domain S-box protein [Acidobacteria bacterium]|nr:PAS domain S-box protein [Acidobacteriota bacterium]